MRGNRPARERFEFSLDARQVASVILGALAALGITFFLGFSLGHRVLERPPPRAPAAPRAVADPLAALDQPSRPDGGEPPKFSFHEALTSARPPPEKLPLPPKPAPPPEKLSPPPKPVGAPAPAKPLALASPPAAPARPPSLGTVAAVASPATSAGAPPGRPAAALASADDSAPRKAAREGAFAVQVGSTHDHFEAERIAARFRSRGAKVIEVEIPGKGRWYRVRLGSFDTREAAERYRRDLEEQTGSKGYVTGIN
ncbi:MAG TPA: SPOR domain-containing protein [Anaeromyxobacteraceae bacterium]|nr:SPOR domain-containing protein [Anaeromyxobacteraceae bacterium]